MEQNVYRSELNRVELTAAGKAALTDALMGEGTAPRTARNRHWTRRGVAAVLAAVLLVGTAAAVTVSLWDEYFGPLNEGQQAVVETLSKTLPAAVTSNGATMTPVAAFGGHGALYLMLEVEAPAGTTLPALEEEEAYWLSGGVEPEVCARLETPDGRETEDISYSLYVTCLEDDDPADNRITLVVNISADQDLAGLTLRLPGLWKWGSDNTFTPVFTGDFAFPISEDMGEDCITALDVAGISTQTNWGPITLETLELSPLGARWSYRIDEATARAAREAEREAQENPPAVTILGEDGSETATKVEILPSAPLSVVLKDGTEVSTSGGFQGQEDGLQVCSGSFGTPVDLFQAAYLLWGETRIPVN